MASSINPNNIDGSYPVAGQDNNSQGFRDNFTNIKVNFQYAEDEINDLQNKVLLKAALTGTTLDNDMQNNTISAVNLNDVSTTRIALSNTSGSVSVNYASGQYQTIAPSAGSINVSVTNWPAAGYYGSTRLAITVSNTSYTVTFNAGTTLLGTTGLEGYTSISAASGYITFAATGVYVFDLSTSDGGSTVTLTDLSRPLTAFTGSPITGASISVTGNVTGANVNSSGLIKSSSSSAGVGYATGAGSTVTQGTSRTTGVTINAVTGAITLVSAAGSSSYNTFTVTNSAVAATDVIIVNQKSGTDKYETFVSNVAAGSFNITFSDTSGTTTEQPVFNFAVIKGVTS